MDFCPECGSMILHGTKCSKCGCNLNEFNLNNLQICIPEEYISDKSRFKNNYNNLLELILNKNQVVYTKEDLLNNYNEIIEKANNNFINKEKEIIQKEFDDEIQSCVNFIDKNKRFYFKSKFNKDYFPYYDNLKFDKKINKFNNDFLNKRKKEIKIEFKKDLNSYNGYIPEGDIEKFKVKYTESYFDFFTYLKMEIIIKRTNRKYTEEQFKEVREKYNVFDSPITDEMLFDLKSKSPEIDWDSFVKDYNRPYLKKKFKPYETTDGVYYLYDYIGTKNWKYETPEKVNISKKILNYKEGIKKDVTRFTNDLSDFIENFIEYKLDSSIKQIFLVSVPSSTEERDKNSSIKKSIDIIVNKYENGSINFDNNQKIIDSSDLLYRKEDITASHIERQPYEVHMKTIGLNKNELKNCDDGVFIILDDISTTGNILNACTKILINNGVPSEKIYKVVIAVTG